MQRSKLTCAIKGVMVGAVLLGAMFGSMGGGPIADVIGRKFSMVIAGIGTLPSVVVSIPAHIVW
jgi:MFS family permease